MPATNLFLGDLHNTTTDELSLFETDLLPESHRADLHQLKADLLTAGKRAWAEGAPRLGLARHAKNVDALAHRIKTRANDWAKCGLRAAW